MFTESSQNILLSEFHQRRKMEALRQQIFAQTRSDVDPALQAELLEVEQKLQQLEGARLELGEKSQKGLLMSLGPQRKDQLMGPRSTAIEAKVQLHLSHIPTGSIHLLSAEDHPLVSFHIQYLGDLYARIRLTSFVEDYSAKEITTVELSVDNPSCEIKHLPTFFPERLRTITELTRATLHVRIDNLDKNIEQENTFPIWLLARTSAHLWIQDPSTGNRIDLTHFLAAWVTPNAPEIMQLLRRAADFASDRKIVGYQVLEDGIEDQVRAIFEALKEQEIHYVNSTLCFGANRGEMMQRIRLPHESLSRKSANCMDGTILMASVLEAASLNPAIVLVPGHAFLAWERSDGSGDWDYLETTMIGTKSFEEAHKAGKIQALSHLKTLLALPTLRLKYGITPME